MKIIKSLVLGSAAALVAVSGAQAVPVKPSGRILMCSYYGAGYYIPGTRHPRQDQRLFARPNVTIPRGATADCGRPTVACDTV